MQSPCNQSCLVAMFQPFWDLSASLDGLYISFVNLQIILECLSAAGKVVKRLANKCMSVGCFKPGFACTGYKMKLIMPSNMTEERRAAMAAYGAELIDVPAGKMEMARDLALELQVLPLPKI